MNETAKTLKALRGAIGSDNTPEAVAAGTVKLYDELMRRNGLGEGDLVSLFFSLTPGLTALNPASALRRSGRAGETAMMVFQEAAVEGSPPGLIRILAHAYLDPAAPARHAYLDGAEKLRPDRAG